MNVKTLFNRYWQHLLAIAIFILITIIYCNPQFQGLGIKQHDVEQYIGSSNEAYHFKDKTGTEQLWTNSSFGGMPTTQISLIHPGNFLGRAVMNFINWFPSPGGMILLHMIGFYIMLLCFRVKRSLAIIGAIGFAFLSYEIVILQAGHNSKSLAVALAAPVIGAFFMTFRYNTWLGIGLSSLFMAFELSCNHIQVTYYLVILLFAMGLIELMRSIKIKEFKSLFLNVLGLIVAYLLAFGVNYSNIKLTNEYAKQTIRGGNDLSQNADGSKINEASKKGLDQDYITQWSYGKSESFTLVSPYVKGGESVPFGNSSHIDALDELELPSNEYEMAANYPVYWGEQSFTSGTVYVGAIFCFLAFLGFIYLNDPIKYAMLGVAILSLMLSWGKNFMGLTDFFIEYLPGYNKFRTVTIILVLIEIIIPTIAILFLQKLLAERDKFKESWKKLLIYSSIFVFILLVIRVSGLGDGYTSKVFDQAQLERTRTSISQQISEIPAADLISKYGVDPANPSAINAFIDKQLEQYDINLSNVKNARKVVFNSSMNRSIGFVILTIGLLLIFLFTSIKQPYILAGFGLIILIDVMGIALNYLSSDEKYWKTILKKNIHLHPIRQMKKYSVQNLP